MEFKTKINMSSSLLFLFLFLALSICCCDGRPSRKLIPHFRKDMANINVGENSFSVKIDHKTHANKGINKSRSYKNQKNGINLRGECCVQNSNSVRVSRHVQPYQRREEDPGLGALLSSRHYGFSRRKEIKVRSVRRVRALVGLKSKEEHINSKKNNKVMSSPNLVAMDYPSAHLGPSINNR